MLGVYLSGCCLLFGQAPSPTQSDSPETGQVLVKTKRFSVGLRGRGLPLKSFSTMQNRTTLTTTTTPAPVRDWTFTTASHSTSWGIGPAVEYQVTPAWTITAELLYSRLRYTKVTSIYWGTDDSTTTTDERSKMFRTEDTRGVLWDVPLLVHHRGLAASGPLSKVYVAAGASLRTVTNVRSSTLTQGPDNSSSTDKTTTQPSRRNVVGAVVGLGFRIVDDFRINWTPEIRYTRWAGSTFGLDSTMSPRNQLEVGMAFTF